MRLYLLLALARRLYAGEQVDDDRQQHQDEAQEHDHDPVPDVLRYVEVEVHRITALVNFGINGQ